MKPKIYVTGNETLKGEFNITYYIFEKASDHYPTYAILEI